MAPFWAFLGALAFTVTAVVALYWRDRALQAERHARRHLAGVEIWQRIAGSWQVRCEALQEPETQPAPEARGNMSLERLGPPPRIQNEAQLFSLANQTWLYGWLEWDPRHD